MKTIPNSRPSSLAQCEAANHPRWGDWNQCWCGHALYSERVAS